MLALLHETLAKAHPQTITQVPGAYAKAGNWALKPPDEFAKLQRAHVI